MITGIVKRYYPELLWRVNTSEKVIYLTFDDGPTPGVTDWVLEKLKEYDAKATFFCLGKNVEKHKDLFSRINREGHGIGNHTYDHLKGWVSGNKEYIKNVMKCETVFKSRLFRPPYGKIKKAQINALKGRFSIVMWDVLSEDYNERKSGKRCAKKVVNQATNGSIVVFHDSLKAERNMKSSLPIVLQHFGGKGFAFKSIV